MANRLQRFSSTSNSRKSDDITSLDSWSDAINNSSPSESSENVNNRQEIHSRSKASSSNDRHKVKCTENTPKHYSEKSSLKHVQCHSTKEMNSITEQLDSHCDIAKPMASTSSTSNSQPQRPTFFANIKNTINKQSNHGCIRQVNDPGYRLNQPRGLLSQSLGSGLDNSHAITHNNGHNYSPSHGSHSGQNNSYKSITANNEFGSDGTDLFVKKLETEGDKVKTKLQSAWNNMKYGWTLKTKTSFRNDSAIILLGKWYHIRPPEDEQFNVRQPKLPSVDEFKQDFASRLWFTYRREFTPLPGTSYTTDCGWGCMLRSGQCMIAQALIQHYLGRDWRIYNHQDRDQDVFHREIIRWFSDISTDNSPFSIYKLVENGKRTGKEPGDWYGPASVAHIFKEALTKAYRSIPLLCNICIYVAQDCTVYKQDIIDECTSNARSSTVSSVDNLTDSAEITEVEAGEWKKSVMILVPVRLGGECLNEVYIPCVKQILSHENCIGIIGGKPKHSLYFLGWQEDKLIYLDPHYCQNAVDTTDHFFPIQSFHCMSPRKLPITKMDPSCTIGFYCKNEQDFQNFETQIKEMVIPKKQEGMYPLFVFDEGRGCDVAAKLLPEEQGFLRIRHIHINDDNRGRSSTIESEDFVIL